MNQKLKNKLAIQAGLVIDKKVDCDHIHSSNCRRVGCNCNCGNDHVEEDETEYIGTQKQWKKFDELVDLNT